MRMLARSTQLLHPLTPQDVGHPFTWELHSIRGDSTNTTAAQSSKAHTCEVSSAFAHLRCYLDPSLAEACNAYPLAVGPIDTGALAITSVRKTCTHLQRVPESCGSLEQLCIFTKQAESIGLKWWSADDIQSGETATDTATAPASAPSHLKCFVFVTDQGSDQVGAHRLIMSEVANMPRVLVLRQWCMRHSGHLMATPSVCALPASLCCFSLAEERHAYA